MKTEEKNAARAVIHAAAADLGVDPIRPDSQAQLVGYLAGMVVRLSADKARLDHIQSLILHCPDVTFEHVSDEDEGEEGFVIDVGGCDPARAWGADLRTAIDQNIEQSTELPNA